MARQGHKTGKNETKNITTWDKMYQSIFSKFVFCKNAIIRKRVFYADLSLKLMFILPNGILPQP